MLQFNRLRLAGFKSFVDTTELLIEPGLTGIVGPNGCGKSNLVEALRWVMGETSAKQVRGGEMDDVIFGGTATRPARNIGEVMLVLDNHERSAPAPFNDFEQIEVSRRIERESGSTYRINGKEVRARDVHLLFADVATGARSPALVSQGRIGAVIAAKPIERRALLEEAAGIIGLHSRRHEAELRLRAAEGNLARLEDILVTLEAQLQGLKKQARQAARYRNLSDIIRKAEASLFLLRWLDATAARETAATRLEDALRLVTEASGRAAGAAARQADVAAGLPELRQAEAAAAAECQRLIIARDGLDEEERRVVAARAQAETRHAQVVADLDRERALAADAERAVARLGEEQTALRAVQEQETAIRAAAETALVEAARAADATDAELAELTARAAADEARRTALRRRTAELEDRRQKLAARTDELGRQRAELATRIAATAPLSEAEQAVETTRLRLEATRAATEVAERTRTETAAAAAAAARDAGERQAARAGLEAEEKTLAALVEPAESRLWPPLIDAVAVEPGYEAALAAALGEDLAAPADEPAAVHWRTMPPLPEAPSLPEGAEPLGRFVKAPPALERRLAQIGVVADDADGFRLRVRLAMGQRLVSRDGALWRWDGFTVAAGATNAAAARLEQRNRLREVRRRMGEARASAEAATAAAEAAQRSADEAAVAERMAREALRDAEAAQARSRDALADLKQRIAEQASRLTGLDETAAQVAADHAECEAGLAEARAAEVDLPDPETTRQAIERLRELAAGRRHERAERQAALAALDREGETRQKRLRDIAGEIESWRQREQGARQRAEELAERRRTTAAEIERLAMLPDEIAAKRTTLLTAIEAAEAKRRGAADRLAEAEARLAAADKELRAAEAAFAEAREERVRAEGLVEQAAQTLGAIADRVAERLDAKPEALRALSGLAEDEPLPALDAVERRVERLLRERDTMGPVNLRAEQETDELGAQIQGLQSEREDLVKAVEKLRHGIAELNREGRERLIASFQEVDRHFRELFVRLFGGGRAHLQLTESEDPLEAGIEIMASPPGKRLQMLSLLSGGEQALTALALLFAVFLTNPSPICVLDEVDAPLDDANVDRFCSLVEEIAATSRTRFLIITHHRLTMARMDRLFGVTMAERGVSQLVSVDLNQAEALRATA